MADAPGLGEQRDFVIARCEQRGAGGGESSGSGAIEHGVDLLGGRHVGGGEDVVAELCNAQATPRRFADGDGIDGAASVGLFAGGDGVEVLGEADAVEAADEDLGVGDRAVGTVGIGHAVEGEGDGVQVALGDDAGGVDELLEVRAALDRGLVEVGDGADGLEIDVDDGVGFGQQASCFGRSLGAEIQHRSQGAEQDDRDQQGNQRAFAHEPVGMCEEGAGRKANCQESSAGERMLAEKAVSMRPMLPLRMGREAVSGAWLVKRRRPWLLPAGGRAERGCCSPDGCADGGPARAP